MRVSWSQAWLMAKEAEGRFLRASRDEVGDALVLWCDYGADPTWRFVNGGPRVSPVSLDTLALAEATKVGLRVWARTFEDITLTWPSEAEPTKSSGTHSSGRVSGSAISFAPSWGRTSK
jgi:hypothetical protein